MSSTCLLTFWSGDGVATRLLIENGLNDYCEVIDEKDGINDYADYINALCHKSTRLSARSYV